MCKNILLDNINKIRTTSLGIERIRKNLKLENIDVVGFCKNKIKEDKSKVYRNGKNYYIINDEFKFTVNASSYTIITAHIIK